MGEIDGMRSLINEYRAKGYGIYGLTNWSEAVYEVRDKYDILQMMDGTLISSEEKLIKPDPAIFRRFCEKFSLDPAECLFTDDRPEHIAGASSPQTCAPPSFEALRRLVAARFFSHITAGRQLPSGSPKFPKVSHQEQNRPLTHLYLLISHIRKTPPCPTQLSRPHPRIPDVSHQEQKRTPTHFSLLICNIRKAEG